VSGAAARPGWPRSTGSQPYLAILTGVVLLLAVVVVLTVVAVAVAGRGRTPPAVSSRPAGDRP
jgi:hypothetical protein